MSLNSSSQIPYLVSEFQPPVGAMRANPLYFVIVLLLGSSCLKDHAKPGEGYVDLQVWKDSVIGALYNASTNSVAYNRPDENGQYKIYISGFDGTNETQLTWAAWSPDRQQWAEEWDPTGQYLFCYIEKTDYVVEDNHTRVPEDAIPGYGAYTDLWIIRRDGSEAWQLTNLNNDYDKGIIHGAISEDGTIFAWTERIDAPVLLDVNLAAGAYVFNVADVTYSPTPALGNIRTFMPGGVLAGGEVESISPDKSTILFYSTYECKNLVTTPIYRMDINTGLTQQMTTESFSQAPTYAPGGEKIVYMTGASCDIFPGQLQGADWWLMNADGSGKRRLTNMNVWNHAQSVNKYRLAGSLSFVNDSTFLGGVMTKSLGLSGYTAIVRF